MHERFEKRIEQRLTRMAERCGKQKRNPLKAAREVGRLLGSNQGRRPIREGAGRGR